MSPSLDLTALIRDVPDFPRPGVLFRDITPLLADAAAFREVVQRLGDESWGGAVDLVAGIESRGFILGGALAHALGSGFVPIRKAGRLPAEHDAQDYELEYGTGRLEMHRDAIERGQRVLLVDDLLATGGTAAAALALIARAGGALAGCAFIVDLPDLGGRAHLEALGCRVVALCAYGGR
jgi:adenine phosphoribosyltransferase